MGLMKDVPAAEAQPGFKKSVAREYLESDFWIPAKDPATAARIEQRLLDNVRRVAGLLGGSFVIEADRGRGHGSGVSGSGL